VILVVPKETAADNRGRCWVATGQGTEGFITDATAGEICRTAVPRFMEKDYSGAMLLVTREVAGRFAQEFGFALDTSLVPREPVPVTRTTGGGIPPWVIFIIFFVVVSLLNNMARRGRRGRRSGCGGGMPIIIPMGGGFGRGGGGWGGGGFGGGGGGFGGFGGGGGFSGGGGGSSW
jgi:uncharacterized protein